MRSTEYPQAPRVGVGAIVMREGKILLIKRGAPPSAGLWAIPGGVQNLGETMKETAEREILEETGITITAKRPVYAFDFIERDETGRIRFHYVVVDLMADYRSGEPEAADDAVEAGFFEPRELENLSLSKNTEKALQSIGFFE